MLHWLYHAVPLAFAIFLLHWWEADPFMWAFVLVAFPVVAVASVFRARCPQCQRWHAMKRGLPGAASSRDMVVYRCRYCRYREEREASRGAVGGVGGPGGGGGGGC